MLKRFLSSKSKDAKGQPPREARKKKGEDGRLSSSGDNGDVVMKEAERELFRYDLPAQERGFGDLIADHKAGEKFPYLAISAEEEETQEARIGRIFRFQPLIKKLNIDLPKRITLDLINEIENLSLEELLRRSKSKLKHRFILVKRMTFVLTPLSSVFDDFTNVWATVVDNRFRRSARKQTAVMNSNNDYKGELSLDYSVPMESLSNISINIALEVPIMNSGEQWASIQIEPILEQSDYPQKPDFKPVWAMPRMPQSGLTQYTHDPTTIDATIHDNHRSKLMDMYAAGDILVETEAVREKTGKVTYSKSTVGNQPISKGEWGFVNQAGPSRMPIDERSISPDNPVAPMRYSSPPPDPDTVPLSQDQLEDLTAQTESTLASSVIARLQQASQNTRSNTRKGKGKVNFNVDEI